METTPRSCIDCGTAGCNHGKGPFPDFCLTENLDPEELRAALALYEEEENHTLLLAAAVTECEGYHIPRIQEIDALLNEAAEGWKTSRMNKVDLTILRLAVYEMRWDDDVPEGVAINEAVELAKRFGGENSSSFVNGVLGKLAKQEP